MIKERRTSQHHSQVIENKKQQQSTYFSFIYIAFFIFIKGILCSLTIKGKINIITRLLLIHNSRKYAKIT